MKYEDRILKLFKNEYLTTKDVNDNDIPRFYLTKLIKENKIKKGDVLSCARIAGIMAAKKTPELIPLCHGIPLEKISVDFEFENETTLLISTFAKCEYKTGVEMEALTAAGVAALTVYDMCKAVDRAMVIREIRLLSKSGGRSGDYKFENEG